MKDFWQRLSLIKRLHWATWCMMLLTAVPLILIMVPGDVYFLSPFDRSEDWINTCFTLKTKLEEHIDDTTPNSGTVPTTQKYAYVCEHGWPSVYMARGTIERLDSNDDSIWLGALGHISWCCSENWPLQADDWVIRPWSFLLDVSIALLLILSVGSLTQWRIHSRGGLFKFNLIDLLVGLTVLGIGLGYYMVHRRLADNESIHIQENLPHVQDPQTYGYGKGVLRPNDQYVGPVWLWKLFGGGTYLTDFYHNTSVTIWPDENWRKYYELLPTYPYLTHVSVSKGLPLDAVESLKRCGKLESLILPTFNTDGPKFVPGTRDRMFQPDDLPRLQQLGLKSILLQGTGIRHQHVDTVAEFPGIEKVYLMFTSVTQDEAKELVGRFPHVEFKFVEGYTINQAEIEPDLLESQ
ncbi:hypothetical protein [Bremerella sp.]|uniref:hypothetical protein n=1 Tax=Bremerella sp. TaxID=2795602 RepID=UPI0039195BBA